MYKRILIAVENSACDRTIIDHVEQLAQLTGAELLLVHVADGWAARHYDELQLRDSEEIRTDRAYLDKLQAELRSRGFVVDTRLGMGDPAREICRVADEEKVDLIAMATHGHRFVEDLIRGETVDHVRHRVKIPVLLVRAQT